MGRNLEFAVGVLNGTVGDYLARTGNGLATTMACVHDGAALDLTGEALARAFPAATPKIAVFVHGLMNTEDVWRFADGADDYGRRLARDHGYTPLYVRYNSGLPIPDNGAAFDRMLATIVDAWPVPVTEVLPVGFSMGGLVVRSACHVASTAGHPWLGRVTRAMYLGTPHLGAPLERVGRVVTKLLRAVPDPYVRLVADIADLRSDGLKDLGDADLRHEDRARRADAGLREVGLREVGLREVGLRDPRHPVPLLPEVRHYLVAGTLSGDPWLSALFGDTVVSVPSATARSAPLPAEHVRILAGRSHVALTHDPDVYAQMHAWLESDA